MRTLLIAVALVCSAALASATLAFAADPAGTYSVAGTNPGGLALYGADGGNWEGVWTYSGGRDIGTEVWKRQ